jgi:FkbM family methyltransferase
MLLEALALSQSEVFFIQVGSNDAMLGDPLRPFLLQYDWSGLMIEPVPYVFERLRRNYWHKPKLIQENVAIGPQDGWARFYCVAEAGPHEPLPKIYDQLGSFSKAHILKHAKYIPTLERRIVELTVPTMTFESLCRKHGVSRIDLLHVDAEGYDYELLKLVDFAAHRPTVLLYEHRHLSDADRVACRAKLEADGYALIEHGADTLGLHHAARAKPLSRLARAWRVIERQPPTTDIASGGPEG